MKRIATLSFDEREDEIFKAVTSGNIPEFMRYTVTIKDTFPDASGVKHIIEYEVLPDYLSVGNDADFCRIPMGPGTAERISENFGASMITSKLSDHIYKMAEVRLKPFNYIPSGNANELITKFEEHNRQIEKQLAEAGGEHGMLVAGIKKDVLIPSESEKLKGKVIIYGWHKPGGEPVQPVYKGHSARYVDYSHGIRLINDQVIVDGKFRSFREILKDPVLFRIFSDDDKPWGEEKGD
jgi:hypothetical protein